MDEEMSDRLKSFLRSEGESPEDLPESWVGYLQTIDRVLERRTRAIEEAVATIRANKVNVLAVSNESGISRKTLYNHSILERYVHYYGDIAKRLIPTPKQSKDHGEAMADLRDQLAKLLRKEVNMEELKAEMASMQGIIETRNKRIKKLEQDNTQLRKQLRQAQDRLSKAKGTIIEFESKPSD